MNTTFDILVIVLSSLLGIFLILAISVVVVIFKLVGSIKRVVAKGEQVIDSAESAAETFKSATGSFSALKMLVNIVETVNKHKPGKGK